MAGALDGVRILDLSWGIAGPLGVLLLAEQGADVIKVEPPGGDPFRALRRLLGVEPQPPLAHRRPQATPAGLEAMLRLADDADVVVETFRPGRHGPARLRVRRACTPRNPRSSTARVPAIPTGTGSRNGPGYDALVQASSGQMWEQPGWRMGPIFLHMPMPSMGAAFLIPTGIIAALVAREDTGAASTSRRRCSRARCSTRRRSGSTSRRRRRCVPRAHGQDVPAGHPPADDLRVSRTTSGCTCR